MMAAMSIRRLGALVVMLSSAACATQAPPSPSSPTSARRESSSGTRTAGWVLVAVGAHAAGVAAGTSAMMLHSSSVRDDECDASKVCSAEGLDANKRLDDLAPWNAGAWILAATALGAGVFLVLSSPRARTEVGVAAGPSGALVAATF